ncbi:uncharacterized protein LOC124955373 isoform X2 [Vespa velutina]|nr:uncharacterized protein LOC124955373 isoform X2 [Vespa velutina]
MSKEKLNNYDIMSNSKIERISDSFKKKHVELSYIVPRPGGYFHELKQSEIDSQDSNSFITEDKTSSLNTMIHQSKLIKSNNTHIDDILQTNLNCSKFCALTKNKKKYDTIHMCGIVISTVMMIANHSYNDITAEHVRSTKTYFQNFKGEDGYPHNIAKILQILEDLKEANMIEYTKTMKSDIKLNEEDDKFQYTMENIEIDEPENDAIDTKSLITPQLEDQIESEIPIIPQSEDDTEVKIIQTEKEQITVNIIDIDDTEETKEAVDVKPYLQWYSMIDISRIMPLV